MLEESNAVAQVQDSLESIHERAQKWPVGRRGWSILGAGLRCTYRQGRDAYLAAAEDRSVENLHEWRKQVKYLWHQLQVLGPTWPELMEELGNQAHQLADHLGDDHDLAVLRELVVREGAQWAAPGTLMRLLDLIDVRRGELQHAAAQLGQRLYADRPKAFLRRLHTYWQAWRADGAAPQGRQ